MGAVRGFDRRALLINRLFLRSREAEPEKGEPSHLNRMDFLRFLRKERSRLGIGSDQFLSHVLEQRNK